MRAELSLVYVHPPENRRYFVAADHGLSPRDLNQGLWSCKS